MLKKIISMFLALIIITVASGASVFAQAKNLNDSETVAKAETQTEAPKDLKSVIKSKSQSGALNISDKSTLADYERAKRQGKGMSTTTKVLIGVGIAVAVIAIVAVVARNDVRNNVLR
jgi:hypothetical protein